MSDLDPGLPTAADTEREAQRWAARAFDAALRVRAPEVHASTATVCELATRVGAELGLQDGAAPIDLCCRVRDVGMLALPDGVVRATGPLSPADWELVNTHPAHGADLLVEFNVLAAAAPVVRSHHERWDGAGYPDGLRGNAIPAASRVISACDAFVAMARDRPHRRGLGVEVALERVVEDSGHQFDPDVVAALVTVVAGGEARAVRSPPAEKRFQRAQPEERRDLMPVLAELDVIPASDLGFERVTDALAAGGGSDLISAIESDIGLTVAVLSRAQAQATRRAIASVPEAVAALEAADLDETIRALPRTQFPWRTPLDIRMHRLRTHAQEVARAAEHIARERERDDVDEVLAAALLHDVGKLVLSRMRPEYAETIDSRSHSPEERLRDERRATGMDHASLGALLLSRWGLAPALQRAVADHHTATSGDDVASVVRLADLVAHHAQGDRVDQRHLLQLGQRCGLPATSLREVLFDLPRAGGSQKRRAEPSPLSKRETAVLSGLAEGKSAKAIAADLGISESTVRSFLATLYRKLEVADRAQAVLKATEMGWL